MNMRLRPSLLTLTTTLVLFAQAPRPMEFIREPRLRLGWSFNPSKGVALDSLVATYNEEARLEHNGTYSGEFKGETIRAEHNRLATRLPLSSPVPEEGWYVDILPAKGEGFRLRSDGPGLFYGNTYGSVWVPEDIQIKAIRVYGKGAFVGEALNAHQGLEPDIHLTFENGTVAWQVPGRVSIQSITISTNHGKTWHYLMPVNKPAMDSGSWKVDFGEATEATISLECTLGKVNFFRKEIVVRKAP